MLGLCCNNGAKRHLYLVSTFHLQFYSNTAPAATRLLDLLVTALGFTQQQALPTSSKVIRSTLRNYEPHLFIALFQEMGFTKSQIKSLVSSSPNLLFSHVDKNLKPKIQVLKELGFSGSQLVSILKKCDLFTRGLDNTIKPSLGYIKKLLGDQDSVASVVKREPWLLTYNLPKVIPPNIEILQNLGFSKVDIETVFRRRPRYLLNNPEWLERTVHCAENAFGIPRESRMFLHGVEALGSLGDEKIEGKLDIFRSFGWSESGICRMVRSLPYCLTASEAKITTTLKFFMNELGFESSYLASHVTLLKYSLEKRIMPRNEILKFLKENQLLKEKLSLYTVVSCSESMFLERYMLPFSAKMPEVYDLYLKTKS